MTFSESIRSCFSKYVTFSGRAQRSEFWYFVLFCMLGGLAAGLIDVLTLGTDEDGNGLFGSIFSLAVFLPSISVAVRRLHDLGRSGWWWWIILIPLVGWIVLIVWYATIGTAGDNEYGPDPLECAVGGAIHRSSVPKVPRQ